MTIQQYNRISAPFRGERTVRTITLINKALTYLCYVAYPVLLAMLAIARDLRFWRVLVVPAVGFVLLSVVRKKINHPRPYQVLEIVPLIPKSTQGKSMPSRHLFCVYIIAASWFWVVPAVGIALAIGGIVMAAIRVIAGIHFPRDVLVGSLVGILLGWVGYWLIG